MPDRLYRLSILSNRMIQQRLNTEPATAVVSPGMTSFSPKYFGITLHSAELESCTGTLLRYGMQLTVQLADHSATPLLVMPVVCL